MIEAFSTLFEVFMVCAPKHWNKGNHWFKTVFIYAIVITEELSTKLQHSEFIFFTYKHRLIDLFLSEIVPWLMGMSILSFSLKGREKKALINSQNIKMFSLGKKVTVC